MTEPVTFTLKTPMGRPKGAKTKRQPKTIAEFIDRALNDPLVPQRRKKVPRGNGIWNKMTPEERSAYAKTLAAKRTPAGIARSGRTKGTPHGWTYETAAAARAQAHSEAVEMVERLKRTGVIAPDDTETVSATLAALEAVRSAGTARAKQRLAKLLLAAYHPEMTKE